MRSAPRGLADLTTRARIRGAAIAYFGEHGFRQTTIRAIAAKAGVSPALVIHHFGSKDGLRAACDAHVTEIIDEQAARAASQLAPSDMLAMMARRPEFVYVAPYLTTALVEGGEFAERLFVRLVDDMESYLRAAVAAGIARPTEGDERTRAEMITLLKLGFLVFPQYVVPRSTPPEAMLQLAGDRLTLPALELFTHGLYLTSGYLDAYRAHQAGQSHQQPTGTAAPAPHGDGARQSSHREGEHA